MPALPPPLSALEARLGFEPGDLSGPERARAEAAIEDASALVLAEAPSKAAAWASSAPPVVVAVVLKAARREYENPQGLRSENLGEHGFSVDTASGVYLTGHEAALIRRAATGRAGGFVGSIRTPTAYGTE